MRARRLAVTVTIGVATIATVAACSGSSESGSSSPTASPSSASPSASGSAGSALIGSWRANASSILDANTANVGGASGLDCSGPITMTFAETGAFTRQGNVTCSISGISRSGRIATTGTYTTNGNQITFSRVRMSPSSPVTDSIGDGAGTFAITGARLEITFSNPDVGEVTQTYRRVS